MLADMTEVMVLRRRNLTPPPLLVVPYILELNDYCTQYSWGTFHLEVPAKHVELWCWDQALLDAILREDMTEAFEEILLELLLCVPMIRFEYNIEGIGGYPQYNLSAPAAVQEDDPNLSPMEDVRKAILLANASEPSPVTQMMIWHHLYPSTWPRENNGRVSVTFRGLQEMARRTHVVVSPHGVVVLKSPTELQSTIPLYLHRILYAMKTSILEHTSDIVAALNTINLQPDSLLQNAHTERLAASQSRMWFTEVLQYHAGNVIMQHDTPRATTILMAHHWDQHMQRALLDLPSFRRWITAWSVQHPSLRILSRCNAALIEANYPQWTTWITLSLVTSGITVPSADQYDVNNEQTRTALLQSS
jgi:hypothetical protein